MHQAGLLWCTVFIADFGLFSAFISAPIVTLGMILEEPSRLRDRDVLRSCLYQSKKKKILIRMDFGRSYRHLSFSKQPMENRAFPHSSAIYNTIFTSSGFDWLLQPQSKSFRATGWFWTGPLQVLGSALAGRVVEARIWPSMSRCLGISFGLRGPSPQAFTPLREVGLIARRLRCP